MERTVVEDRVGGVSANGEIGGASWQRLVEHHGRHQQLLFDRWQDWWEELCGDLDPEEEWRAVVRDYWSARDHFGRTGERRQVLYLWPLMEPFGPDHPELLAPQRFRDSPDLPLRCRRWFLRGLGRCVECARPGPFNRLVITETEQQVHTDPDALFCPDCFARLGGKSPLGEKRRHAIRQSLTELRGDLTVWRPQVAFAKR
jgi:hypothetical protein